MMETTRIGSSTNAVITRANAGGTFPRNDLDFGFGGFVFKYSELCQKPDRQEGLLTHQALPHSRVLTLLLRVSDQFQSPETAAALLVIDDGLE